MKRKSKYKTSRGIPWSEIPIRELPGMIQDGIAAFKLLMAIEQELKEDEKSKAKIARRSAEIAP